MVHLEPGRLFLAIHTPVRFAQVPLEADPRNIDNLRRGFQQSLEYVQGILDVLLQDRGLFPGRERAGKHDPGSAAALLLLAAAGFPSPSAPSGPARLRWAAPWSAFMIIGLRGLSGGGASLLPHRRSESAPRPMRQ